MKILKNILLFILKSAVIAALILASAVGWGFLLWSQQPGGILNKGSIPPDLVLIDLLIILPINLAVIIGTAILLSRAGTDKEKFKNTKLWKKIAHPAGIIAAAASIIVIVSLIGSIEEKYEEISVKADIARADEIITYENNGNYYGVDIFDSEIYRDSMLLDYDEMTVTFLYRMDYDNKKTVQLTENGFVPDDEHILQFKNPLEDDGEVRVYYDKNGDEKTPSFKTCAVTVEHSGKLYGTHFDPEPMGFWSELKEIYLLEERGLETVIYHDNELLPYAGNVKSDTIFLDPENNKIYLVYLDTSGLGVPNVRLDVYELVETDISENIFIQAEFELKNGNRLFAFGNEDYTQYAKDPILKWQTKKTDGLILKYNNKLYTISFRINDHYDFLHSTCAVYSPNKSEQI